MNRALKYFHKLRYHSKAYNNLHENACKQFFENAWMNNTIKISIFTEFKDYKGSSFVNQYAIINKSQMNFLYELLDSFKHFQIWSWNQV